MAKKLLGIFVIIAAVLLLAGTAALYYAIENVLPYSAIRPYRVPGDELSILKASTKSFPSENFSLMVDDSICLKGILLHTLYEKPKGLLLILHGIGNCKEGMLPAARTFLEDGFDCVVYDQRAHGESGGLYCTYGYYEKYDCMRVADFVSRKFPGEKIAIYGNSLGAGIALQAMALDKRIVCGIIESPFSDLRSVAYDYFVRMSGIPLPFISNAALSKAECIADFSADSASPLVYAPQITQPVLLIHGMDDRHVYFEHSRRIFPRIGSKRKQFYAVPGGNHYNLPEAGGEEYRRKILEFTGRELNLPD